VQESQRPLGRRGRTPHSHARSRTLLDPACSTEAPRPRAKAPRTFCGSRAWAHVAGSPRRLVNAERVSSHLARLSAHASLPHSSLSSLVHPRPPAPSPEPIYVKHSPFAHPQQREPQPPSSPATTQSSPALPTTLSPPASSPTSSKPPESPSPIKPPRDQPELAQGLPGPPSAAPRLAPGREWCS